MPIDNLVRGRGGEGKFGLQKIALSEDQSTAYCIVTVFAFKCVTKGVFT